MRYNNYRASITIEEALRCGALPKDLDHDFARGFLILLDVQEKTLYDLQLQEADLYSDDNASAQAIRCDTFFRAVAKCMWCVL